MSNSLGDMLNKLSQMLKEDSKEFNALLNHFGVSKDEALNKINSISKDKSLEKINYTDLPKIVENMSPEELQKAQEIYGKKDEIEQIYKKFMNGSLDKNNEIK